MVKDKKINSDLPKHNNLAMVNSSGERQLFHPIISVCNIEPLNPDKDFIQHYFPKSPKIINLSNGMF